jgi:hypothetical protein
MMRLEANSVIIAAVPQRRSGGTIVNMGTYAGWNGRRRTEGSSSLSTKKGKRKSAVNKSKQRRSPMTRFDRLRMDEVHRGLFGLRPAWYK